MVSKIRRWTAAYYGCAFFICAHAHAGTIVSEYDKAAIERDLASQGKARVVVDLIAPPPTGRPDATVTSEVRSLIDRFLARGLIASRNVARLSLSPTFATEVTASELTALLAAPEVRSISYNGRVVPQQDQRMPSVDTNTGRSINFIGAIGALYNSGAGGQSQIVAIVDSGVASQNFSVAGRVIGGHCFSTTDADFQSLCPGGATDASGVEAAEPCAVRVDCDHGTAVASLAAGLGVTPALPGPYDAARNDRFGVAPLAFIYPIQVFSQPNTGDAPVALLFDLRRALQHIYLQRGSFSGQRFAAVNLSLNSVDNLTDQACDADPFADDVRLLRSVDIATVISAGNAGDKTKVAWPACISDAVVVASSTPADQPSTFTNFSRLVDLFAPGESVDVAMPNDQINYSQLGTSFAAPHVTGAFAVIHSASGTVSVAEVERALSATGKPIRVGNLQRRRVPLNEAASSRRAEVGYAPRRACLKSLYAVADLGRRRLACSGRAAWEVVHKPGWVDVSGFSGTTPDNEFLRITLNRAADTFANGTTDVLPIRNRTVVQPDIEIILVLAPTTSAQPSTLFRVVKINN